MMEVQNYYNFLPEKKKIKKIAKQRAVNVISPYCHPVVWAGSGRFSQIPI